jgi:hypothetical protein
VCRIRGRVRAVGSTGWALSAPEENSWLLAPHSPSKQSALRQLLIDAVILVLADAEFDSERNHTYTRKRLGAQSVIPAKRGKKTWRIHGVRGEMRRSFPRQIYRRRALIETLFSSGNANSRHGRPVARC